MKMREALEIGSIIKYTCPKSIGISLNGEVTESKEKDVNYLQIEGFKKKRSKFGYDYLEYKVFNLTTCEFKFIDEMFIKLCIEDKAMEIVKEFKF